MNFVSLVLVAITGAYIGLNEYREAVDLSSGPGPTETAAFPEGFARPEILPDIYYIILDDYAREDILNDLYGFDNSEFLDYLENKGFYIARNSRSNYAQTLLSLGSSLNLRYHDYPSGDSANTADDRIPLPATLKSNQAEGFLRRYGYELVAFPTGYLPTERKNAELYLKPALYLNEFQNTLINTTFAATLMKRLGIYIIYDIHRNLILNIFERLGHIPRREGPVFVFAHIISPHPPFVFGKHGERVNKKSTVYLSDGSHYMKLEGETPKDYVAKYSDQLKYVNSRLREVIDIILSDSSRRSIIILQADHGPGSGLNWDDPGDTDLEERLSILNAFYFPDRDYSKLYDEITPVNTFRLIFARFFGADYELLKDESYFSTMARPYDFIDIGKKVKSKEIFRSMDPGKSDIPQSPE
ncbi:MAG: sulfatase-like hydrolase/transferase [candidate division Zixibacteria bacterium]